MVLCDHAHQYFIETVEKTARAVSRSILKAVWDYSEDFLHLGVNETTIVGTEADKCDPLLGMAQLRLERGMMVESEVFFRAVESNFKPMFYRMEFTAPSADLYVRYLDQFACFLYKV